MPSFPDGDAVGVPVARLRYARASMADLWSPRFPAVRTRAGHYESYYCRMARPGGGEGIWIRYTTFKRPGEPSTGSLWFTRFRADGPQAVKQDVVDPAVLGDDILIGDARLSRTTITGTAEAGGRAASWDLRVHAEEGMHEHLPRRLMYSLPVPRTKSLSAFPSASFSGTVTLDGETLALDAWPGMLGHNWGAEHAERWLWLHATDLGGRGADTWFDAVVGRIRIAGKLTPWIANGTISIGGERHRLGGIERTRATTVAESLDGCTVTLPGKAATVVATFTAPRARAVAWRYADPDGSEHHVVNNSVADASFRVQRPDGDEMTLSVGGTAAYELGMREQDHGVPLQPYD